MSVRCNDFELALAKTLVSADRADKTRIQRSWAKLLSQRVELKLHKNFCACLAAFQEQNLSADFCQVFEFFILFNGFIHSQSCIISQVLAVLVASRY